MRNLYSLFVRHPKVATDSRDIPEGAIFFALRGERFDGNGYAADALARGASYAVVDDPGVAVSDRYILVDDVLAALQNLAAEHRKALGIPVLAITGSNGKTTTKELVTRVLRCKYNATATKGNLNNHIGVPLTLLSFTSQTEFGIVEMGANHPGEIAALCRIALPDYGLITNIGRAHLEGFGTPEGVARAKGELFDYLAYTGGKAFYLEDDPVLGSMAAGRARLATVPYADSLAEGMKSNLAGAFNRYNIAAAVAVGKYFGVAESDIAEAISSYVPGNMRSQRVETSRNIVILDCYNANPSSMHAALENLRDISGGKPIAVILGDMGELGDYAAGEHKAVLERSALIGAEREYLVGQHFARAATLIKPQGERHIFANAVELGKYLASNRPTGMAILVKGSHAVGLEKIAELL